MAGGGVDLDGWLCSKPCKKLLLETSPADSARPLAEVLLRGGSFQVMGMDESLLTHIQDDECGSIGMKRSQLPAPNGGISFCVDPVLQHHEAVVSINVKYSVKFPDDMHWNKGGFLPGAYGVYCNNFSTSARVPSIFECRWRWDARGKLGVYTRHMNDDPNEWQDKTNNKITLARDVWYDLTLAVHVDGKVVATVDGKELFNSSCSVGLEILSGVKFSVMCTDNTGVEDKAICLRGLCISADIDTTVK
jgi:hypothetical protein